MNLEQGEVRLRKVLLDVGLQKPQLSALLVVSWWPSQPVLLGLSPTACVLHVQDIRVPAVVGMQVAVVTLTVVTASFCLVL